MISTNLTIKNLFTDDTKLTFLVGAGCSVDIPSCLPAGRAMMEAIIRYTCAEPEIEKILELEELRFEQLVEIVRDHLDPELKIIDYYAQCDKPNLQHFFLAKMIKEGHFVMTTNFDFLIEYALLQSNIPKDEVIPVITKSDFEEFNNPIKLFEKGKKTVYKIHGSTKNVISGDNTKDSLIATIRAFGSNKEGLNVFQVEPFKRPLFDNISDGRTLVVLGYSGSDDFDIVPSLNVLKNLKSLIWIDYIKHDGGRERIYEIEVPELIKEDLNKQLTKLENLIFKFYGLNESEQSKKVKNIKNKIKKNIKILQDFKRINEDISVYIIKANTTRLIKEIMEIKPNLNNFSISPLNWLKSNIISPSDIIKWYIPYKIYFDLGESSDAMKCIEKVLEISEKSNNLNWKATALYKLGEFFKKIGYPDQITFQKFKDGYQICNELGDLKGQSIGLYHLGKSYYDSNKYSEARELFYKAISISEELNDIESKANYLLSIGLIFKDNMEYDKALKIYEEVLKIKEYSGDLSGKAECLCNIAKIYENKWDLDECLKRYEEALMIFDQLGNLPRKADLLAKTSAIYGELGNSIEQVKREEEAFRITGPVGDMIGNATNFFSSGIQYLTIKMYPKALRYFKTSLTLYERLGNLNLIPRCFKYIGTVYKEQGNYLEALKQYDLALKVLSQLDLSESEEAKIYKNEIEFLKSKIKG
ncbi:MAG: tetratricopeptide repeat protein [Promethearchaeota archaeon]